MNLSTGINLQKELNAIMRRVKKPKIHDKEECIFCCDDNYDDGYDYKNHEVYDLEDEDENENLDMRDMMQFDSKILMYLGVGIALGALGVYLLRRQLIEIIWKLNDIEL